MASIVSSANRGTASAFDLVNDVFGMTSDLATDVFGMASKTVGVGSTAIDALDEKTKQFGLAIKHKARAQRTVSKRLEIMEAARSYIDILEDNYKYITGKENFDRKAEFEKIKLEMEKEIDLNE